MTFPEFIFVENNITGEETKWQIKENATQQKRR